MAETKVAPDKTKTVEDFLEQGLQRRMSDISRQNAFEDKDSFVNKGKALDDPHQNFTLPPVLPNPTFEEGNTVITAAQIPQPSVVKTPAPKLDIAALAEPTKKEIKTQKGWFGSAGSFMPPKSESTKSPEPTQNVENKDNIKRKQP